MLKEHNLPTPYTALLCVDEIQNINSYAPVVFIKKRQASQGRHQFVVKKLEDGSFTIKPSGESEKVTLADIPALEEYLLQHIDNLEDFIIQNGINVDTIPDGKDGERIYDLRVVVQRTKRGRLVITGSYMRIGAPKSDQANISQKGHPHDPALVFEDWREKEKEIKKLCFNIFHAFDYQLGELGVDIIINKEGRMFCLEINTRPGSKGFQEMCSWVTTDAKHRKNAVIPYEYSNRVRALWGKRLNYFRENPFHYAKHMMRTLRRRT